MTYIDFLKSKVAVAKQTGFECNDINPALFPHQKDSVKWCLKGGRRAVFASFGNGKTCMGLELAYQCCKHTGKPSLIILPLGVRQEFKSITTTISQLLEIKLNPHNDPRIYMSREVTFDYSTIKPIRVDYMLFKSKNNTVSGIEKGDFYCYEIKSCVDDFNSKHGHNFIGDYNYYVMPIETYHQVKDRLPYKVGVYVYDGAELKIIKKAKQQDRNRCCNEMLLMMFRSANREVFKNKRSVSRNEKGNN